MTTTRRAIPLDKRCSFSNHPKWDRLPKWAQEIIEMQERERGEAVRTLNEFCDNQTRSSFQVDEMVSMGETNGPTTKTNYVQGEKFLVHHDGIELQVSIYHEHIELIWGDGCIIGGKEVGFIPTAFQQARLVRLEKGKDDE